MLMDTTMTVQIITVYIYMVLYTIMFYSHCLNYVSIDFNYCLHDRISCALFAAMEAPVIFKSDW